MVAEAKLGGQPGVIEGAGEIGASFVEVGPAVVVGRDDHRGYPDVAAMSGLAMATVYRLGFTPGVVI